MSGLMPVAATDAARALPGERIVRHASVLRRVTVTVTYAVDDREHQRRRDAGIGAVTDIASLDVIHGIPVDDLVRLDAATIGRLTGPASSAASLWFLTQADGSVWARRRLEVPVRPLLFEVRAGSWRRGLEAAHRLAGYGPRRVIVSGSPRGVPGSAAAEADYYGVGLTVTGDSVESVVVQPGAYEPRCYTAARWSLAETIYEQFLTLASAVETDHAG